MSNQQASYRSIMKATSLFGGVQVYSILIQILRSKFIALFLGPEGLGIIGLLNSGTGLIASLTNCGLGTSAVKNISEADATNDKMRVALVISVVRKLVFLTGLIGVVAGMITAPYLSKMAFGNTNYTIAFIILSINILLIQLTSGQVALLQGLKKYNYLAKANIIGSTIGLFIALPLYYFWGIKAVVPVLVLANFSTFGLAYYFGKKDKIENVSITIYDIKKEGKSMIVMGFYLGLQGILSVLASYLIQIFISTFGKLEDVGLFNAGFTIVNTYVGLVFTAMATDFYPRLSGFANDIQKFNRTINQQAEISLLLLGPLILGFIIYMKGIIIFIYSNKFLPAQGMIYWAISAVIFKAMSWSLSYSLLAKGDGRAFFWNEITTIFYSFGLNLVGYYFYGLNGLGISSLITYVLYLIQLYIFARKRYGFSFDLELIRIFIVIFIATGFCLLLKIYTTEMISYIIGTLVVILSIFYSFKKLDNKIKVTEIIWQWINRKSKC